MRRVIIIAVILFIGRVNGYAKTDRRWGIGITYPGVSLKYSLGKHFHLEGKIQFEKGIIVMGLREYLYFNFREKFLVFAGLEEDYVTFKSIESEGDGYVYGVFIGSEYFLLKNISLQVDIGPMWLMLRDRTTSIVVNGMDYITNVGLNWYFK